MGYKFLGFVVWQGGKIYFGRRMSGPWPKVAIAGVSALIVGGAIAAGRHQADE